ncbi:MAG: outer membrane protein assembly factor, partial [Gemmatimonadota bacterium]|nr:outer membrane protein assembly factor [Gemmatimonadota bacterium]
TLLWNANLNTGSVEEEGQVSVIQPYAIYSVQKQFSVGATTELFLRDGNLRVSGSLSHRYFPTRFWGVGNATPDAAEELYTPREVVLEARVQSKAGNSWFVGGLLHAGSRTFVEIEPAGMLSSGSVMGSAGGQFGGVGLVATFDSREHTIQPRDGSYLNAETRGYADALGADFAFVTAMVDARRFIPIGSDVTLAARALLSASSSGIPFDLMPRLGGENLLRGYFEGRYRDKNLVALQSEIRFPVWWRFSGVAFGSVGQVAPRLADLSFDGFRAAAGGGLRFLLQPQQRLNLRLDIAGGSEGTEFYMGMQEAF